ncbi:MAG: hypothetical protein ABIP55_12510, partial [Tepidisphaeraceae bacterium]
AGVKRFKGRGILWEMYNEPNLGQFWKPSARADDYIKLALEVAKAVKDAAPEEALVGSACSGFDWPFLEACFKAGLLEHWSAVTMHPYRRQAPETAADDYRKLRLLIAKYAPKGKSIPIYCGEWGYSSVWENFDADRQAIMLARQWLTNIANDVPLSIWYDWRDDGADAKEPEHHFGTVDHSYRDGNAPAYDPKPAYVAARTLTTQLAGYRFNKRLTLPRDDDHLLLFIKAGNDDDVKLVTWTSGPDPHTVLLPASAGEFDIVSHTGQSLPSATSDVSGLSIVLGPAPQYLAPRQPNAALRVAAAWERVPLEIVAPAGVVVQINPGLTREVGEIDDPRAKITAKPIAPAVPPVGGAAPANPLIVTRSDRPQPRRASLELAGGTRLEQQTVVVAANPLRVIVAPPEPAGMPVRIENPSVRPFFGSVRVVGAGTMQSIVRLDKGQTEKLLSLPLGSRNWNDPVTVELIDESGKVAVATPAQRFVPIEISPETFEVRADGDAAVKSSQRLEPIAADESPGPGISAVKLIYDFEPGWKFVSIASKTPEPMKLEGKPAALGIWTRLKSGSHEGAQARIRFTDDTGQTFQPDVVPLTAGEWRYTTFALDGESAGHWGGANDGVIHYPIKVEALFLLDNVDKGKLAGEVIVGGATVVYEEDDKGTR